MNEGNAVGLVFLVIIWIAFSVIVGAVADSRGRDSIVFFFFALIASPLIVILVLIALPMEAKPVPGQTKCPHCHGLVDLGVRCCMHCARDIIWEKIKEPVKPPIVPLAHPVSDYELAILDCKHCGKMFSYDSRFAKESIQCSHCFGMNLIKDSPAVKHKEMSYEAECPDCGKPFPVKSNLGIIETLCPHCQSILKLDTAVA